MRINKYYDLHRSQRAAAEGWHREILGGFWDEIGHLTFDFLISRGLQAHMCLLDVGCGPLRVGVHLVEHLEPGHFFGVDISEDLLNAGYEIELARRGVQAKLPRRNLLCDGEFNFDRLPVTRPFDMAIAQSLFSHLPLNHIRLCITNLTRVMAPGGVFYATLFCCHDDEVWAGAILHERGGITTYPAQDPYHYRFADIQYVIHDLPWTVTEPEDWDHPRDQSMVAFTRTTD